SVNELLRDLRERSIRTKTRPLSTGATRGGIPFGRGALYYLLSNHFYIGEVKYKNEILPGEQPPIMDRALFDAVRQKSLAQWSHRTIVRNKSDYLLAGLVFDDGGHRMVPTHATKAGVRYRYYVSTPFLHGDGPARNGVFLPPKTPNIPGLPNGIGRRNPAAGNGIFGCRDGRLKSAGETGRGTRDRRAE